MFGSASQKPAFSFGASSATPAGSVNNNTSSNPGLFGASANNNNTASSSGMNQPSSGGFSFNKPASTSTVPSATGFSFNKQPSSTAPGTGLNFGGSNNAITSSKPSLFGNSSTNPAFGNTASGLGFGQSQTIQQQQHQQVGTSPYGVNLSQISSVEMPKPITSPESGYDTEKLKRKRSDLSDNPNAIQHDSKNISLVGRLVDTFKAPSKYSIENVRGLFTSARNVQRGDVEVENSIPMNNSSKDYLNSLSLNIPKIPASKSEYKRLIIKNPRDSFAKFEEIDANSVLLLNSSVSNNKPSLLEKSEKKVQTIDELKPSIKRIKTESMSPMMRYSEKNEYEIRSSKNDEVVDKLDFDSDGTVNTASDYWSSPAIAELSTLSSLELTHVENFSVGRKNHGNLMFKYPVDLTAFENNWDQLLGKTIIFQNKTLQVYPDDAEKPSQGNGLNVPAVITLEKVLPKKFDIKNPDHQLLERHIQRLKSAHGMKFVSFDPLNGNYVFEVEHFSIWGIVDEEDDDPEIIAKWRKQQESELTNEKRKNEMQINALEKIAGYGQPGDNWKRKKHDYSFVTPGALEFDIFKNADNDEANNNNFEEDEDDEEPVLIDALVPHSLSDENANLEEQDRLALVKSIPDDIGDLVQVRAYEPEVKDIDVQFLNSKNEFGVSENWDEQLNLTNGFFSVFNKSLTTRNNMKLTSKNIGDLIFADVDSSTLKKAIVEPPLIFNNIEHYRSCLQTEITSCEYSVRSNGLPKAEISDDVSLNIPLKTFNGCDEYHIWELLSILYDDNYLMKFLNPHQQKVGSSCLQKLKHILDLKRREILCQFLQKITSMDVNAFGSLENETIDKIYYFICANKLGDAIQYAINTKNNHLAVLLTTLDSNDKNIHRAAQSQLNEWSNGSISFIPNGVLKIYKLLVGDILSNSYIDHLAGLSWPIVLFLLVKYGDYNKPLSETIKEFVEYAESRNLCESTMYQKFFLIFKMVNQSKEVISEFDVTLQFLLIKHLKPYIEFSTDQFDEIIQGFTTKLEKKSLIEEAVYVLEHLTNDDKVESLLPPLINNHVSKLKFLKDDFRMAELQSKLHVPMKLLHEARSFEFNRLGQYYESTLELLASDNLVRAHELVLNKVAPNFIISNIKKDLDNLTHLVEEFSILPDSKTGADVYGDYIKIITISRDLDSNERSYQERVESLKPLVESVLERLSSLKETNDRVKVAKTIMSKRLIGISFNNNISFNRSLLENMELPESERSYLASKFNQEDDVNMITY